MKRLTRFTFVSRYFENWGGYMRNSHTRPLYLDVTAYDLDRAEELARVKSERVAHGGLIPYLTLVDEVPA
jgi:hypothetical protein